MSTAENFAHFGINFDLSLSHTHGGQQEANEKTNIVWCDDNLPNHRKGRDYIERSDRFGPIALSCWALRISRRKKTDSIGGPAKFEKDVRNGLAFDPSNVCRQILPINQ